VLAGGCRRRGGRSRSRARRSPRSRLARTLTARRSPGGSAAGRPVPPRRATHGIRRLACARSASRPPIRTGRVIGLCHERERCYNSVAFDARVAPILHSAGGAAGTLADDQGLREPYAETTTHRTGASTPRPMETPTAPAAKESFTRPPRRPSRRIRCRG
jgi:hypothetical protein